jgi:hypothetical protein
MIFSRRGKAFYHFQYLAVNRRFAVVAAPIRFCKGESLCVWVLNNFK